MKVSDKRICRLKLFFSPYPKFEIVLKENLKVPIELKKSENKKKTKIFISSLLLINSSPLYVEPYILKVVLKINRFSFFNKSFVNIEKNPYYQSLKRILLENKKSLAKIEKQKLDSDILLTTWQKLKSEYFPNNKELDSYSITWAKRKRTRLLASCNINTKEVVVSYAMNDSSIKHFLSPLIYHEMCHAVLGKTKKKGRRNVFHGKEFKILEDRHPEIKDLNTWIKTGGWDLAVKRNTKPIT